jgi:hypothetical protein
MLELYKIKKIKITSYFEINNNKQYFNLIFIIYYHHFSERFFDFGSFYKNIWRKMYEKIYGKKRENREH